MGFRTYSIGLFLCIGLLVLYMSIFKAFLNLDEVRFMPDHPDAHEFSRLFKELDDQFIFIPLLPDMMERVFGEGKLAVAFHLLAPSSFAGLVSMQGSDNALSTTTAIIPTHIERGVTRGSTGLVAKVRGNILFAAPEDAWTHPDRFGRRYIPLFRFLLFTTQLDEAEFGVRFYQEFRRMVHELMAEYRETIRSDLCPHIITPPRQSLFVAFFDFIRNLDCCIPNDIEQEIVDEYFARTEDIMIRYREDITRLFHIKAPIHRGTHNEIVMNHIDIVEVWVFDDDAAEVYTNEGWHDLFDTVFAPIHSQQAREFLSLD